VRRLLLALAIAFFIAPLSSGADHPRSISSASVPCVRRAAGFNKTPTILEELQQVYANCTPRPACVDPMDTETIEINGYENYSDWLWYGVPSTIFTVAQQDEMITDAINRVGEVSGKVIVDITFFRDLIVPIGPVTFFIGFRATFARCGQVRTGMTWIHSSSNAGNGTVDVGCMGCDPYSGDTVCTQSRPLLCIYQPSPSFAVPLGMPNSDVYHRWSGGVIATTPSVAGNTFHCRADADDYCSAQFGAGWRVAEFHDGWGWNFRAYGGTVNAPSIPSSRFWVHINDQPANCWN
jgi:hypothetical protein